MINETKWTPGPWRVFGTKGLVGRYVDDDYGSVEVCKVGAHEDIVLAPFNQHRWKADAHLIAAAPDLYEALSIAVKDGPAGYTEWLDYAEEVLAKARGEQ